MRKTVLTAATVAMSAALAGFAFAASPSGSPTTDTSVVSPVSTAGESTSTAHRPTAGDRGHGADDVNDAPDDSDGRVGGGHGADDVNDAPDDSDGRVGGGHGSDDGPGDDSGRGSGRDDSGRDDSGHDDSGHDDSHDGPDDSDGRSAGGHGSDD